MHESECLFVETTLSQWENIFKINYRFLDCFIFRGQQNANWELSTSLERQYINNPKFFDRRLFFVQEKEMLKEFQWKYPLYSSQFPDFNNYIEWLSIMQHHGSATRLLDFTQSFIIAFHFAVSGNYQESAVWAINKNVIQREVFFHHQRKTNRNEASYIELNNLSIELANEIILSNSEALINDFPLIYLKPNICNQRIAKQQGLFLMQSDLNCALNKCFLKYCDLKKKIVLDLNELIEFSVDPSIAKKFLIIKILIPKNLQGEIERNLKIMNINNELLFPGLDGLAKSVNYSKWI